MLSLLQIISAALSCDEAENPGSPQRRAGKDAVNDLELELQRELKNSRVSRRCDLSE